MSIEMIIAISTFVITYVLGLVVKKLPWFNNYLIPVQNISIGIITTIVYYIFTKDLNLAITTAGVAAGGVYDIVHNIQKIIKNEDKD